MGVDHASCRVRRLGRGTSSLVEARHVVRRPRERADEDIEVDGLADKVHAAIAHGGGIFDRASGIAGWTKLSIEADDYASGGAVRFYIDNSLVGSSFRAGANGGAGGLSQVDLRYVRIGNNRKSYENIWYDDVRVSVPEPASATLLGLAGMAMVGCRRRRR
jgi:hypothetical protein